MDNLKEKRKSDVEIQARILAAARQVAARAGGAFTKLDVWKELGGDPAALPVDRLPK